MNTILSNFSVSSIIITIPAIIIALTVHEFAHGFAAYKLGDLTAKDDGRLSFNPLKHIDPIGFILLIVVGFGWAKPVNVNPNYFENPKKDMAYTAFAGPLSNFILAFICALINYPILMATRNMQINSEILNYIISLLLTTQYISVGLGVFNLFPFPPLDGSKVLAGFLPDFLYIKYMQFERFGFVLLILCSYLGILSLFISPLRNSINYAINNLVSLLYFFIK